MNQADLSRRKLRPVSVPPGALARPRLAARLAEGLREGCFLTLLSAGPGYGKTTAAARHAAAFAGRVAWYRLDGADRDPVKFLAHLEAALSELGVTLGQSVVPGLAHAKDPVQALGQALERLSDAWASTLAEPALLVLDDLHEAGGIAGLWDAFAGFLEGLPARGHVLVTTRVLPELPLPLWRVRRQAIHLTAEDMALDEDEVTEFLAGRSGTRPGAFLERAAIRTEGWLAALLLAIESGVLPGGSDDPPGGLADYLVTEIVERREPESRAALLLLALLPELVPDALARAMGADARARAEELADSCLLVRLPEGAWRMHPVLRDVLRIRGPQLLLESGRSEALCRVAEIWASEDPLEALRLWQVGLPVADADARAVALGWEQLRSRHLATVSMLLDRVSPAGRETAEWRMLAGERDRLEGHFDRAASHLARAADMEEQAGRPQLAAEALAHLAAVEAARGEAGASRTARRALRDLLPERHGPRGLAETVLGVQALFADDEALAREHLERALEAGRLAADLGAQARVQHNLGLLHARHGRFGAARASYEDAIRLSREAGLLPMAMTANNLGALCLHAGDPEAARRHLDEGLELARLAGGRRETLYLMISLGDWALRQGHVLDARTGFTGARDEARRLGDRGQEAAACAGLAQVALVEGQAVEAERLMREALDLRAPREDDPTLGDMVFTMARVQVARGRAEEARSVLARAVPVLRRLGYRYRLAQALAQLGALGDETAATEAAALAEAHGYSGIKGLDALPAASEEARIPALAIRSFGSLEVEVAGRLLTARDWQGNKPRVLLAYLLVHPRGSTKEELAEHLYGERDTTRSAVHVVVSRLRQALEPGLARPQDSRFLKLEQGRYRIALEQDVTWDAAAVKQWLDRAAEAGLDPGLKRKALEEALSLETGRFLAGMEGELWAVMAQESWRRRLREAFGVLVALLVEQGEDEAVLTWADRVLGHDRTCEEAHVARMEALARLGRADAARRQYRLLVELLERELGVVPTAATEAAWRRISSSSQARGGLA